MKYLELAFPVLPFKTYYILINIILTKTHCNCHGISWSPAGVTILYLHLWFWYFISLCSWQLASFSFFITFYQSAKLVIGYTGHANFTSTISIKLLFLQWFPQFNGSLHYLGYFKQRKTPNPITQNHHAHTSKHSPSFKGCTCFAFTKRRLCTCTLPGIITNTFTHTQLTALLMHRWVSFPIL